MWTLYYRTALSYVTGSHSFKFGVDGQWGHDDSASFSHVPYSYTFNSPAPVNGVYTPTPNSITLRVSPTLIHTGYGPQLGAYAQDQWVRGRLTASAGLRSDHFGATVPVNSYVPTRLAPTLNLSFPAEKGLDWNDLSPKLSAVYDLFGNGKTALKASANRYLSSQTDFSTGAQYTNVVTSTTRTWKDNGNFIPDCNLLNPLANGVNGDTCGKDSNTGFGTFVPNSATHDPSLNDGWFKRSYNWEFLGGVQQQILPRVSADVSYFRRIYGNFSTTVNTAVTAADFSGYCATVPSDPRLPNSGGQLCGLYDVSVAKAGTPALNYTTFSDTYGKQISHWNGVDVSLNARPQSGLLLQGGFSTGKTLTDNCAIVSRFPQLSPSTPLSYCHVETPFLTQVKAVAAYTVPKIDVLVSGTYQSIPGPQLAANRTYTSAEIKPSLGRDLSAGSNATVTVNLVPPGTLYGERVNQIDFRVGKVIKYARIRSTISLDLYNQPGSV